MLSVIIATLDSERALVPTLAALVPGRDGRSGQRSAVADGGSRDDTAAVADVAGCNFMRSKARSAERLKAAAAAARAPWLLFLRPGTVLDAPWIGEARRFRRAAAGERTRGGVPARRAGAVGAARRAARLLAAALGALPRPSRA